jgi:lysozyme
MLSGIDISHHNKNMKDPNCITRFDFVIMKASEGQGFKDRSVKDYTTILKQKKNPLIGFYHFARPEINSDPWDEARNFIEAVTPYLNMKPILALDVEARALTVPMLDSWCLMLCMHVKRVLGITPLIYCSAAETKRFKQCCDWGCGLWVAKWSDKISKKDIKPWEFWAIWQKTSNTILSAVRVDTDVFNGTKEQFLKYAEVIEDGKEDNTTTNDSGDRTTI